MDKILEVKNLLVTYKAGRKHVTAVDDISFFIEKGHAVGLVGESGCGKTSLGNAIMSLVPYERGEIIFDGNNIDLLRRQNTFMDYRKNVQMIFQDPYASLNPRMNIGSAIMEVFVIHKLFRNKNDALKRTIELLKIVGLEEDHIYRYPHEFSGGQRQRIGIARALATSPSLVIADEPVSALDVSIQVQVLNLFKSLQSKYGLSYLFISHDLSVVRYICDYVMVMYLGKIVESGPISSVYTTPAHPYTLALLSSVPDIDLGITARKDRKHRWRVILKGDVPSGGDKITGCRFHPRCNMARDICKNVEPPKMLMAPSWWSCCHFANKIM